LLVRRIASGFLQAGYNMHVAKPLEPRELIAVIAALVTAHLSGVNPIGDVL